MKALALLLLMLPLSALGAEPLFPTELNCQPSGKIKYVYGGKEESETATYCFSPDFSYFLSANCREGGCLALEKKLGQIAERRLQGPLGNPGFRLCREAGGDPQLLEYYDGSKWRSNDRCFFLADRSYVDTGILVKKWAEERAR